MEFSFVRLKHLLVRDFQKQSKSILFLFLVYFVLGIFATMFRVDEGIVDTVLLFSLVFYIGQYSFKSYYKSVGRINELVLPASVFEKLLSLFLVNFVGVILVVSASTLLGIIFVQAFIVSDSTLLGDMFDFAKNNSHDGVIFALKALFILSLYFYASLLLGKYAFFVAVGVWSFYSLLLNFCKDKVVSLLSNEGSVDNYFAICNDIYPVYCVVFILGFLILTYLRMKEESA